MTRLHKYGSYRDGYQVVEYCTVCSAEGDKLLEDCQGNFSDPRIYFQGITKAEFEEKYQKAVDAGKQKF